MKPEDEYSALRAEILYFVSQIDKYFIATIIAYSAFLFWGFSNPTRLYIELFAALLFLILLFANNIIWAKIYSMLKVSSYIAVFHELKNNKPRWEVLQKKVGRKVRPPFFGQSGTILGMLATFTLPLTLIDKLHSMSNLTGNLYPYCILIQFFIYNVVAIWTTNRYRKKSRKTFNAWLEIAVQMGIISKEEKEDYESI